MLVDVFLLQSGKWLVMGDGKGWGGCRSKMKGRKVEDFSSKLEMSTLNRKAINFRSKFSLKSIQFKKNTP